MASSFRRTAGSVRRFAPLAVLALWQSLNRWKWFTVLLAGLFGSGLIGHGLRGLIAQERASAPAKPSVTLPAASEFEDAVAPLRPARQRSEAEEDRVLAAAYSAAGRLAFQRDDFAAALRQYQRAWRYDPDSVQPLADIVPVAMELTRNEEAARYAAQASKPEPGDLPRLMRLAATLGEQRDWRLAARLYELVAAGLAQETPDFTTVLIQMELGRLYFLLEKPREAALAFAQVRDALADPAKSGLTKQFQDLLLEQPERTYELFGESFLQAKRHDEALAMFRKASSIKPQPEMLGYHEARVALDRGDAATALRSLEPYLNANLTTAGPDAYELLVRAVLAQYAKAANAANAKDTPAKDTPARATSDGATAAQREAIDRLQQLQKRFPANDLLLFVLADQQRKANQSAAAEVAFRQLLERAPTLEVIAGLRDTLASQGKWDEVLETLAAVARSNSVDQLAELVEPLAARVDELIQRARKIGELGAKTGGGRRGTAFVAALLALEAERFDVADEFFAAALKEGTPNPAFVMQVWALGMFSADQQVRATRVLQRAIDERVRPESDPTWHYFLAGSLELQGRTDEAMAKAAKALTGSRDNPQFAIRLAWIPYHAKRYEEAESAYRKLVEKFDAAEPTAANRAAAREARLTLSNIALKRGRAEDSVEWLEQVLDEFPDDVAALNDLGYLWADRGQHLNRALAMCRRAVAVEPDNRAYRDSLAWALFKLDRPEEASREIELAVKGAEPDGELFEHLGDIRQRLGDRDGARTAWQRAAEAYARDGEEAKRAAVAAKAPPAP
ncbi:MAG: tetratricopeptide repeat protein [Planctomycetota bacterium]